MGKRVAQHKARVPAGVAGKGLLRIEKKLLHRPHGTPCRVEDHVVCQLPHRYKHGAVVTSPRFLLVVEKIVSDVGDIGIEAHAVGPNARHPDNYRRKMGQKLNFPTDELLAFLQVVPERGTLGQALLPLLDRKF